MAINDRGTGAPTRHTDAPPQLCARLTTSGDGTTECTIFPKHVSDGERTTTWISAEEGSFVDFEELR